MIDRHRKHSTTTANNQGRHEPMHMIESGHAEKCLTVEDFDSTSRIRRLISQNSTANAIRNSRTEQSPPRIFASLPESSHHHQAIFGCRGVQCRQHCRDVAGIVLPVAIQRCDDRRDGSVNSRHECRTLATGGQVPHDSQRIKSFCKLIQQVRSRVRAPVVDNDDFKLAGILECVMDLLQQPANIFRFVMNRNDNR